MGESPGSTVKYHHSRRFSTYAVIRQTGPPRGGLGFWSYGRGNPPHGGCLPSPAAPRTGPGGEFDWGGTSVKA